MTVVFCFKQENTVSYTLKSVGLYHYCDLNESDNYPISKYCLLVFLRRRFSNIDTYV